MSNTRRPMNPGHPQRPKTPLSTQIGIGLVALACIAAIVVVAVLVGNGKSSTASEAQPTPTAPTPTTPAAPSTTPTTPASLHCTKAPQAPGSAQHYKKPPSSKLAQNATWAATIKTNCGDVKLQLYGDKAPQTVASFLFLAQHGFWNGSPCHRLTTSGIYVLQCGDPTGTGTGGPGYGFGIENAPSNGAYPAGTLAMARASDPNSNGSQFFMVYKDTELPTTGGGYTIFGKVTGGMKIIKDIATVGVGGGGSDGAPAQPISILGVTVHKQ